MSEALRSLLGQRLALVQQLAVLNAQQQRASQQLGGLEISLLSDAADDPAAVDRLQALIATIEAEQAALEAELAALDLRLAAS